MTKALVLFSGGLDSRLAVKLLQEEGCEVETIFFKLPFGGGCCNDVQCSFKYSQVQGVKLHIIDCCKGKLLKEYLELIKHPKHGTGAGINPCKDCKIFMFKYADKFRKKIKAGFLATGEVIGQRPMSQTAKAMEVIDKKIKGIRRPLIERGIRGRSRKKQMKLAEKYKITYPSPGGGCILCEEAVSRRIKFLLEKNLITEKTLQLSKIGRHFYKDGWMIVARDKEESEIIEQDKCLKSGKGKPAVYGDDKEMAESLQKAYSTGGKWRKKFQKWKI